MWGHGGPYGGDGRLGDRDIETVPFAVGELGTIVDQFSDPGAEIPLQDKPPGRDLAQDEPVLGAAGLVKKNLRDGWCGCARRIVNRVPTKMTMGRRHCMRRGPGRVTLRKGDTGVDHCAMKPLLTASLAQVRTRAPNCMSAASTSVPGKLTSTWLTLLSCRAAARKSVGVAVGAPVWAPARPAARSTAAAVTTPNPRDEVVVPVGIVFL